MHCFPLDLVKLNISYDYNTNHASQILTELHLLQTINYLNKFPRAQHIAKYLKYLLIPHPIEDSRFHLGPQIGCCTLLSQNL